MRLAAALVLLLATAAPARADDDAITGFEATGSGELGGHVVGADGKPLRGVEIHVVSKSGGEQIFKSDHDGYYHVVLKGAQGETSMVFVRGHRGARFNHIATQSTRVDGGEAIEIHETSAPTVAKAIDNTIRILEYSEAAQTADEWLRAWLTLEIDETGAVRRVKWLRRPGHDLDAIAVREAFALRFEPARDGAKHAVVSELLWVFEWPSRSWLDGHRNQDKTKMPADFTSVPCQKANEHRHDRRDCSQPDVTAALGEASIAKPKPPPPAPPPKPERRP